MNAVDQHRSAVADELGDILAVVPLAQDDAPLAEHLFGQLVDLLVEGLFLDLRSQRDARCMDASAYAVAHAALVRECHAVGLLQGSADPR